MSRCTVVLVSILLATPFASCAQITARDVFNKAAGAGRHAGKDDRLYIFTEIANAQAKRGYYDDALKTLKRTNEFPALNFADVVEIRARNGDIRGAKAMIGRAPSAEAKWWALRNLGLMQAESGDIEGARNTVLPAPPIFQQVVLREIGFHQVRSGDLEAALRTVDEMERGEGDGILVDVAAAFSKRGDEDRAQALLSRLTDPDIIRELNKPSEPPPSEGEQRFAILPGEKLNRAKLQVH